MATRVCSSRPWWVTIGPARAWSLFGHALRRCWGWARWRACRAPRPKEVAVRPNAAKCDMRTGGWLVLYSYKTKCMGVWVALRPSQLRRPATCGRRAACEAAGKRAGAPWPPPSRSARGQLGPK
ncbi:MAG: hypothetical protein J3K34DRAFT_426214 [Monoraphidium minutum]|nr:MAG: hypothetical protein J3K34DRAFT_426214 [Monoraphidium minutum]